MIEYYEKRVIILLFIKNIYYYINNIKIKKKRIVFCFSRLLQKVLPKLFLLLAPPISIKYKLDPIC